MARVDLGRAKHGGVKGHGRVGIDGWVESLAGNYLAYILAGTGAVSWALYSNISKRYAAKVSEGPVPLFLLVTGFFLMLLCLAIQEPIVITIRAGLEVGFVGLFPMLLAYSLWDFSVRRGNLNFVASMSYLTPLLSVLVSCLYLGISPSWLFWCGCSLVVIGAVICKLSISNNELDFPLLGQKKQRVFEK